MNNFVTMIGNLTREPAHRIAGGVSTVNTGIAVNRRWKNRNNEQLEATSFYNVVAWGPMALNIGASLHKGDRVVVVGRMETREWTDDDGKRHQAVELIADEIAVSLRFGAASLARRRRVDGDLSAANTGAVEAEPGDVRDGDPGWTPDGVFFADPASESEGVSADAHLGPDLFEPALV
jgi:single-strand DNA-binding protein